jgi:hypothetical protein
MLARLEHQMGPQQEHYSLIQGAVELVETSSLNSEDMKGFQCSTAFTAAPSGGAATRTADNDTVGRDVL